MAIGVNKYVDVTSGTGERQPAKRRDLIANVFTRNDKVAHRGIVPFTDTDEVLQFFGSKSEEYRFAAKYFGHISKSVTRPMQLSFTAWDFPYSDETWRFYDVTVKSGGYCYIKGEEDAMPRVCNSLQTALDAAGDYAVVNILFEADAIFTSSTSASWKDGVLITKKQHVYVNLNGHKYACYNYCFRNEGFLRIYDPTKMGCVYVVNKSTYDGRGNIDAGSLSAAITSSGRLVIDGGWFGTNVPRYVYSPCNYGPAVEVMDGTAEINGGNFTNGWFYQGRDSEFSPHKHSAYTFTATNYSRIVFNGGTVYGLSRGCFGVECAKKPLQFAVLTIKGGKFYAGLPNEEDDNRDHAWVGFVNAASSLMTEQLPAECRPRDVEDCYSFARIEGGYFRINMTGIITSIREGYFSAKPPTALKVAQEGTIPTNVNWLIGIFRGRVSIDRDAYLNHSTLDALEAYNYDVDAEFYQFYAETPVFERVEKPVEAISRTDGFNDNFGSYCFLEDLELDEIRENALWNAEHNFKYLYSVNVTPNNVRAVLSYGEGRSGTVYTLDKFDALAQFMPMALFAATRYDRVNATKTFMYQQFAGEKPSVTTSAEASRYDAFDYDGLGSKIPVNYYGVTQQAGSPINFYQDGFNADGLDTACYCNEVWMKDAITVEIMNTFLALEKMPADNVGEAMVRQSIVSIATEAIRNDTISVHKSLSQIQKTYVDQFSATEGAWRDVENIGYWIGVKVRLETTAAKRSRHVADYVFVYAKGDAIRKVEGSDILI